MRSLLFVPADSETKINKAFTTKADVLILDIEDSVAPANKPQARELCRSTIINPPASRPPIYIRLNDLNSDFFADDIAALKDLSPDGLILPKTQSGADITKLSQLWPHNLPVIAIATETAKAMFGLGSYHEQQSQLAGLSWGAEDLSNELGALATRNDKNELLPPYQLARSLCLYAACAANVEPIDTVYVNFRDDAGLKAECKAAMRDGFTGKLAIHPSQVPIINRIFTPSQQAIDNAKAIIAAFSSAPHQGVVSIDGKMYDLPHLKRAQKLLARNNC